jgi:hypothetical protein
MLRRGSDAAAAKVAYLSSRQAQFPSRASARLHRETMAMMTIIGLNCIYDTSGRGWAMEITVGDEKASRRFDLDSAEDAEMLIEAFEESTAATFDPESGEIRFAYAYAEIEDEDSEDDEEEAAEEESDEDESDEDGDGDKKRKVA